MPQYFVHDGDGCIDFYDSPEEARAVAKEWIESYRDSPEWDEAVERIWWGLVRQHAVQVDVPGTEFVDYVLKDVP